MPPRTRISEAPQRISTKDPHQQRRNSSDSDPLHHRSPRLLIDRKSPRSTQSDPLNPRKLGTRISDLESQLVQAQWELKNLKQRLAASPESAKNDKNTKNKTLTTKNHIPPEETDVFEVPMEKALVEPIPDLEMDQLDTKDSKREPEFKVACQENEMLKKKLDEVTSELTSTKVKEQEMALKHTELKKELDESNEKKTELMKNLKTVESAKEELEAEMKLLRVQTEQWRKAADAAAAVLAEGDIGRISERCGSMEKHFNSVFETPPIGDWSPEDDIGYGFGGGKRKGSGIKMFGDLWKKKSQK